MGARRQPMSARRALAIAVLVLGLAPGTFVRTPVPEKRADGVEVRRAGDLPPLMQLAGFERVGVWELASPNIDFGGFSALVYLDGRQRLRAFSDRGIRMTMALPDGPQAGEAQFNAVWERGRLSPTAPDIEAAVRDPASGTYWIASEGTNAVWRYSAASRLEALRQPLEWSRWPENAGPEAMAQLPDGRFLVLPEGHATGVIHPGDPTVEAPARRFAVTVPEAYSATDLAALPDGRVLVLLRHVVAAYPPFTAALGIANPAELDNGDVLMVRLLLDLDSMVPRENYEGMALQPLDDGRMAAWIIADDNLASFQRTLLVKLAFDPAQMSPTRIGTRP
ncbi:hypothetical protein GRI62_13365 [Erythrobacter arachoides]|uniref:Phytase-like domain-containing protein n=1 Tax=Aurantiacibacter arachoides TaxID=1850444 RepID=A0A845A6N4_9SPHN|nr:esterase-like activity of phytase family protein [Aurantiacibacter arachoides]MXO94587.1 hypothetical protein [Aurantiacibacter arachoides]GGD62304.1 hypothetical protein GCM10011411_23180 [Aurantiacibacter arachoides]